MSTGSGTRARLLVAVCFGLLALLLTACGSSADVASVSLAKLTSDQEQFDGSNVRTQGRLRAFEDPDGTRYVVVEDAHANRVLVEPSWAARRFLRARVTIVGCFNASPTSDRTLRASSIVRARNGRPHALRLRSREGCRPAGRQIAA